MGKHRHRGAVGRSAGRTGQGSAGVRHGPGEQGHPLGIVSDEDRLPARAKGSLSLDQIRQPLFACHQRPGKAEHLREEDNVAAEDHTWSQHVFADTGAQEMNRVLGGQGQGGNTPRCQHRLCFVDRRISNERTRRQRGAVVRRQPDDAGIGLFCVEAASCFGQSIDKGLCSSVIRQRCRQRGLRCGGPCFGRPVASFRGYFSPQKELIVADASV